MLILKNPKTFTLYVALVLSSLFLGIPALCHAEDVGMTPEAAIQAARDMTKDGIDRADVGARASTIETNADAEKTVKNITNQAINNVNENDMKSIATTFPNVDAMPIPDVRQGVEDLAEIVKQFEAIKNKQTPTETQNHLLVMVSFSIPKEGLDRIIADAEIYHADLVFRGLVNNNMNDMRQAMLAALNGHHVTAYIDPPLFEHFEVTHVPVIVIGNRADNRLLDSGCAKPDNYIKISGDVSIRYALEKISHDSLAWSPVAEHFLAFAKNEGDSDAP